MTSTWPRNANEAAHLIDTSRNIALDMPAMDGFISLVAIHVGGLLTTLTAWERPEHVRQLMRNDNTRRASPDSAIPGCLSAR